MNPETGPGETIQVEVVYASPAAQRLLEISVPRGTTALEAVKLSGIAQLFPEIDMTTLDLGIFAKPLDGKGRPRPEEYVLAEYDRVEIYRPLTIDPMQARLARAAAKQAELEEDRARREQAKKQAREDAQR